LRPEVARRPPRRDFFFGRFCFDLGMRMRGAGNQTVGEKKKSAREPHAVAAPQDPQRFDAPYPL
jgi:hypothetical protein